MVKRGAVTPVAPRAAAETPIAEPPPEMTPAPEPQPSAEPAAPLMPKVASVTSDIRTLIFNVFVLLLVGLLAPVVISQFWRNEVVIEPIAVPGQLQTMGLTPEVAAARLVDALREVDRAGGSLIDAIDVVASTDRVDFSIPDSGLSIDSLVYYVRRFLNIEETRIGGEFRCADADCSLAGVSLRLRVFSGEAHVLQIPAMQRASEDQYFYDAALRVMEAFRPIVALAAIIDDQPVKAEVMARRIIRSNPADAHWAHNLLGLIKVNAGQNQVAAEEFSAALTLAPGFVPAKANLANVLLLEGQVDEARRLFEEVQRAEPNNVRAAEGLADLAGREGNRVRAVELYRRATELDPTSTRYLIKAAMTQLAAGEQPGAMLLLEEALQIDPSDPGALAQLGLLHFTAGDYAAAVPFYRNAADYSPADADLQFQAGRSMLMAGDLEPAVQRLEIAVGLAPANIDYKLELAYGLGRLERHEDAHAVLADAAWLAPQDSAVIYQQAINFHNLGRDAEAIAAYRQVIDLDPDSTDAIIARRFIELAEAPPTTDHASDPVQP